MDLSISYYKDNTRISNSNLGMFIKNGPKYLREILDGTREGLSAKYLDKGTMIHMYLLQPEDFWKEYELLDFEMPKSKQAKQFIEDYANCKDPFTDHEDLIRCYRKAYKCDKMSDDTVLKDAQCMANLLQDYLTYIELGKAGKKIISWSELNMLKTIKSNVENHKKANELLFNPPASFENYNEFHINWEYPNPDKTSHIKCKSLLDRLMIDHVNQKIILVDVKTTVSVQGFAHSIDEYDYKRQLAYYWLAIHWYFKHELQIDIADYTYETYIVAIQNNDGYAVRVFKFAPEAIEARLDTITNTLAQINWHIVNDLWEHRKEYYEGDGSEELIT